MHGFLRKFWGQFFDGDGQLILSDEPANKEELRVLHNCIKKVSEDIDRYSMNTCVSHFMILSNELRTLKCSKRSILESAVIMLAPFAPHMAEELWHVLGHTGTVCDAPWPLLNLEFLKTDSIVYPVQINGKHRGNVEVDAEADNATIQKPW